MLKGKINCNTHLADIFFSVLFFLFSKTSCYFGACYPYFQHYQPEGPVNIVQGSIKFHHFANTNEKKRKKI